MKTGIRKLRFLLLAGLVASLPGGAGAQSPAAEPVGHVVAASGSLKLAGADGQERRAARQAPVYRQDVIRVGDNGYLQLRFTDGALLALRPGSEFKVAEYRFDARQAGGEKAVFELVKGGMRTITGAIGKKNPDEYKVETPVATIGIRGTHYGLRFCESNICGEEAPDGLYGGVADGAIGVANNGGDRTFGNDRYFYVPNRDTLAQDWLEPRGIIFEGFGPPLAKAKGEPGTAPAFSSAGSTADEIAWLQSVQNTRSADPVYVESDNLTPSHEEPPPPPAGITGTPAPAGSVALTAFKGHDAAGNPLWVSGSAVQGDPATIYTDYRSGISRLVTHLESASLPPCAPDCTLELASASMGEGSWTGLFSWGRWSSGWTLAQNGQPGEAIGDWHVLYTDQPTSSADLQDLRQRGVTATFDLYSAPSLTDEQGNAGQYLPGYPSMRVNFGQSLITDYALGVSFANTQREFFGVLAEPTTISSLPVALQLNVACTGCTTAEGAGSASVVFAGSGADYALTSWEMHTLDRSQGAVGSAALVKHEYVEPPPITGNAAPQGSVALTAFKAHGADGEILWTSGGTVQGESPGIYTDTRHGVSGMVTHLAAIPLSGCAPACTLDQDGADLAEGGGGSGPGYGWTWGRWLEGWTLKDGSLPGEPYGSWQVLYSDRPTQPSELTSLAYGNLQASFHFHAGGSPTDAAGNLGSYHTDRPFMLVDFGQGAIAAYEVGVNFSETGLDFSGTLASPVGFSSALTGFPLSVTCIGCDYPATASGRSDIAFVGSNAGYALNSWEMHAEGGQGAVGAAVLAQTPLGGVLAPTDATALVAFRGEPEREYPDRWFVGSAVQGHANIYTGTWDAGKGVAAIDISSRGNCLPSCALLADRAQLAELGTLLDGTLPIASWGRWMTGWDLLYRSQPGQAFGDWQFVYTEHPTSTTDLDLLQSRGVIATFSYLNGPSPTDESGNVGIYHEGTPSFEMNFGNRTIHNYLVGAYFPTTGRDFSGATPQGFSTSTLDAIGLDVTCTGCAGEGSGSGLASVAFAGAEAGYALTSWEMHTADLTQGAVGSAVLERSSAYQPLPAGSTVLTRDRIETGPYSWTLGYSSPYYRMETVNGHPDVVTAVDSATASNAVSRGTATLAEYGSVAANGLSATWGRWAGDWQAVGGTPQGDFHFIQSTTPTPNSVIDQLQSQQMRVYFDPVNGQGTSPTDGMGNVGSYASASPRATVNFATGEVEEYYVGASIPSTHRSFTGELAAAQPLSQAGDLHLDVTCRGCSSTTGVGLANLFFAGGGTGAAAAATTASETIPIHAITSFSLGAGSLLQDNISGTHLLYGASFYPVAR